MTIPPLPISSPRIVNWFTQKTAKDFAEVKDTRREKEKSNSVSLPQIS